MVELLTADDDAEIVDVGEVRRPQDTTLVDSSKDDRQRQARPWLLTWGERRLLYGASHGSHALLAH